MKRVAQQLKHQAFVGRVRVEDVCKRGRDTVLTKIAKSQPFDAQHYLENDGWPSFEFFLSRVPEDTETAGALPRRIFLAWTGDNEMPDARRRHVDAIRSANPGVDVVLVTGANLDDWIVSEHPLHPSYEHLSAVHRSDYLRAYLLHHHGGGWSDIKEPSGSWAGAFDAIEADPRLWLLGYPEQASTGVAYLNSVVGKEMRKRFASLAANCAFILRPHSPFTTAWLDEVESRLSYYERALNRHPAQDPFGETGDYPVPWAALQGQVFQPLQLRYPEHIALDDSIRPDTTTHR